MKFVMLLGLALFGAPAMAWSQSCTVSATALAFPVYQPLSNLTGDASSTVTVQCNTGLISLLFFYTISMTAGTGTSVAARSMGGTGSRLNYQIYSNMGETAVWGDGTLGTGTVTDGYLLGIASSLTRNYTAYGHVPASQNVNIGSYTDMITVMVSY